MKKTAVISPDGRFRYLLTRTWREGSSLLFVMLNPSTADADLDDPTIRRCMNFATRDGYSGIEVVNLYAYRSTDPKHLWTASDPIGPDNDRHIVEATIRAGRVVAAWGAHAREHRANVVRRMLGDSQVFGFTNSGQPRHPLMLRSDTELRAWGE